MLFLYGIKLLALSGISQAGFESPGISISELLHSLTTSLAENRFQGRSDIKGRFEERSNIIDRIEGRSGCRVGGVDYREGSYVPLDAIRRCLCEGGVITQYCKFPSFQVQTNFNVDKNKLGHTPANDEKKLLSRFQTKTNSPGVQVLNKRKLAPGVRADTRVPEIQVTNQRNLVPSFIPVDTRASGFQITHNQKFVDNRAPRVQVTNQKALSPIFGADTKKVQKQYLFHKDTRAPILQATNAPKLLPSFQVQTNFGVQKLKVSEKIQKFPNVQVQFPSFQVETPGLGVGEDKTGAAKVSRNKPRKSSGRGKARLFRLFAEEKKPVVRTSNGTGCLVRGDFYNYPVEKVPAGSTCRCTDKGMLWCFSFGIPTCTGCFVDGRFLEVGQKYELEDGKECTCHCGKQAGNEVCMEGTLAKNKGIV